MMTTTDNFSIFLANSRMGMVFDEFGFAPAIPHEELGRFTDQHGFEARAEFVLALDPDVIFILDRNQMAENIPESAGFAAGFAAFLRDPIIQRTQAYQNNHIYALYPQEWYTVVDGIGSATQMVADMSGLWRILETENELKIESWCKVFVWKYAKALHLLT